eukprot:TRINITY_DN1712_c0_g2_i4.p1 TRINITY_DN1712_c0_g2~~TRINITY_DN1712_c0_g2_i4.p1  ORF type:complete len:494 (-),score=101.69 TRINITY_DN1712_c0_g2_i4:188-1633(-)
MEVDMSFRTELTRLEPSELAPCAEEAAGVEHVNLKGCSFAEVPADALLPFRHLRSLDMQANNLRSLEGLERLARFWLLEPISPATSPSATLTPIQAQGRGLRKLNLCLNELESVDSLASLTSLETLLLGGNLLQCLPDLRCLTRLRTAKLNDNQLNDASAVIDSLPCHNLAYLSVTGNNLSKVPPSISHFTALVSLSLGRNSLESLPEELGTLLSLQELDVSFNYIHALPDSLCNLRRLRSLTADNNAIARLPPGFDLLRRLRSLSCARNAFTVFPTRTFATMALLGSLRSVNFQHNHIEAFYEPPGEGEPPPPISDKEIATLARVTIDLTQNAVLQVPPELLTVPGICAVLFSNLMQEFMPGVFIGDMQVATCAQMLHKLNVTHILNCAFTLPDCYFPSEFKYLVLNAVDDMRQDMAKFFPSWFFPVPFFTIIFVSCSNPTSHILPKAYPSSTRHTQRVASASSIAWQASHAVSPLRVRM